MWEQPEMKVAGVIPYLQLSDAKAAVALYEKAFAAKEIDRRPVEDGRLMHCHLEINGGALMLSDAFPEYGMPLKEISGVTPHIATLNPQDWWDRAVAAGLEIVHPIKVEFWGDMYGQLRDPFGVTWAIVGPAPAAGEAA
ncbi:MAG: VOC family protein [Rhizobiaceae bacterium]|nr:VOC family protein [Rhizobiaceae bacterium]